MGLFDKLKEPVFLKESSNAEEQLERLKDLEPSLNPEGQAIIRQDIKCLEYGMTGEKNIAFELRNSHMPMYILHDLYLEDGDLSTQIDYLVFTKKICFIIVQLVKYIKSVYEQSKEPAVSEEKLLEWAKSYLDLNKEVDKDYTKKYEQYKMTTSAPNAKQEVVHAKEEKRDIACSSLSAEETEIFKELKAYRLSKSREENIKAYLIYNDNQLKELITKMPRNKVELQRMPGFDETKTNKYGEDILAILCKY